MILRLVSGLAFLLLFLPATASAAPIDIAVGPLDPNFILLGPGGGYVTSASGSGNIEFVALDLQISLTFADTVISVPDEAAYLGVGGTLQLAGVLNSSLFFDVSPVLTLDTGEIQTIFVSRDFAQNPLALPGTSFQIPLTQELFDFVLSAPGSVLNLTVPIDVAGTFTGFPADLSFRTDLVLSLTRVPEPSLVSLLVASWWLTGFGVTTGGARTFKLGFR